MRGSGEAEGDCDDIADAAELVLDDLERFAQLRVAGLHKEELGFGEGGGEGVVDFVACVGDGAEQAGDQVRSGFGGVFQASGRQFAERPGGAEAEGYGAEFAVGCNGGEEDGGCGGDVGAEFEEEGEGIGVGERGCGDDEV